MKYVFELIAWTVVVLVTIMLVISKAPLYGVAICFYSLAGTIMLFRDSDP